MNDDDAACEEMLVDHEAERQDTEARMLEGLDVAPMMRLITEARKPEPRQERIEALRAAVVRASLLALAAKGNDWLRMVERQATERERTFAKRSGARLMAEPITKKRIEERRKAIAAAREVDPASS